MIRICSICRIEKPATSEFFYWHDRTRIDLRRECKQCVLASQMKYRRARGAKPFRPASTACSVDRCTNAHYSSGFCLSHYNRNRRYGTPLAGAKCHRKPSVPVTLDFLFDQCIPEPNSGCWIWLSGASDLGYGRIQFNGRTIGAHRASYILSRGLSSLPSEIHICHKCDNPSCINPDHLFAGTAKDNMQDCLRKGRQKPSFIRGEQCHASVLNAEQVSAIKSDATRTHAAIAREYGVSRITVSRIRNGLQWRHI